MGHQASSSSNMSRLAIFAALALLVAANAASNSTTSSATTPTPTPTGNTTTPTPTPTPTPVTTNTQSQAVTFGSTLTLTAGSTDYAVYVCGYYNALQVKASASGTWCTISAGTCTSNSANINIASNGSSSGYTTTTTTCTGQAPTLISGLTGAASVTSRRGSTVTYSGTLSSLLASSSA